MLHIRGGNKAEGFARSVKTLKMNLILMFLLKFFSVLMNYEHFCPIYFVLETITSAHHIENSYIIIMSCFTEVNVIKERLESITVACAWLGRRGPMKLYFVFVVETILLFSTM